ncbi:hypothetical protein POTOM_036655 [Populus tomentosa]|uniref:Uncharacterized protein n=1 Tax=Populus tomentosa TaxID=118781 RepID=A0A8X7YZC3_POPTO|nr:hypothetical protein POTOM_036655 [Populus tomentosa]
MKNSGTDIQVDERNGRRLVLFPLPLQGHVNPMIQLANILHSKGFSITIIHTTFNSPDPSKYPHFTFHSIQEELTETEASTADIIALASSLNIKCVAPFRDCVSRLLSDVSEDPIACLISDAIFHFTAAVSKGLKLPRIVLRTGGASSFRIFTALPFLKEKGYLPIQESQLEEPMVELPPFKVKDLPVINSRDPESVYDLMVSMADGTKASSGVIWNTFEELEQPALAALRHEFSIPIFPIGPFHNRFPSSSSRHINPMIQLANILYSKGFSITIIHTQFNAPNPSKCPHFTFHEIPDGLLEDEASTADGVILFSVLNSKCVEPFRDSLANLLLDAMDQEPVACLITDAAWHFTHAVAEGFKIPTIAMRTTSICSFLAFASFPLLREKGYFPIQDSRLEESVQELPPLKVKDLPVIITRFPATLHQLFEKISNQAKACSGLIWNSFEEIERDALSKLSQLIEVVNINVVEEPIAFLITYVSWLSPKTVAEGFKLSIIDIQSTSTSFFLVFAFFSHLLEKGYFPVQGAFSLCVWLVIATVNEAEFLEMVWGLASSYQPFLWVVRPGFVQALNWLATLPNGFLEMVGGRRHIVKCASQQEVLAHPTTEGFWTHNGWNSML